MAPPAKETSSKGGGVRGGGGGQERRPQDVVPVAGAVDEVGMNSSRGQFKQQWVIAELG